MTAELCPVCQGRGKVPARFYNPPRHPDLVPLTTTAPEQETICRSCWGRGYVGLIDPPIIYPVWPQYPASPWWQQTICKTTDATT